MPSCQAQLLRSPRPYFLLAVAKRR